MEFLRKSNAESFFLLPKSNGVAALRRGRISVVYYLLPAIFILLSFSSFSQAPVISSFSPTSGPVLTSVTITGTNFAPSYSNNRVYFGAIKTIPVAGNATSLTVTVPTGATSITPIIVLDITTGLQASSITSSTPQFTVTNLPVITPNYNAYLFNVGNGPFSVAATDFNGDGKADIATANKNNNNVSILLADGSGGFTSGPTITVNSTPVSIATGDFNGDGNSDFVTANYGSDDVSISIGDGSGGFLVSTTIAVGTNPQSIAIGDFNVDGKSDIAVTNSSSGDVSIRLGDGSGGFTGTTDINVPSPYAIAVGDLNNDGIADLAVTDDDGVSILIGDGIGGFSTGGDISLGTTPYSVAIGDFNGDGNADIATANFFSGNASVRLGDGLGGFSGSTTLSLENNPISVVAGDFNGDGKTDLAIANQNSNNVSIEIGDGLGNFTLSGSFIAVGGPFEGGPTALAVGDFNGDGKADVTTANQYTNNVSVFLWSQVVPIISSFSPTFGPGATTVMISGTNFNANPLDNAVYFGAIKTFAKAGSTTTLLLVDVPQGATSITPLIVQDVATGLQASSIASSTPHFNVTNSPPVQPYYSTAAAGVGFAPQSMAVSDFNGDGKTDFAAIGVGSNIVSIRLGDGNGGFSESASIGVGTDPQSVATGDFNGDGIADFATANYNSSDVSIRLGNGAGGFTGSTSISVGINPYSVTIADFNRDGKADFATANSGSSDISISLGDGAGGFLESIPVSDGNTPYSIAIGDFNSDSILDMVTANNGFNNLSILLGDGTGNFTGSTTINTGTYPLSVSVGDFNSDGNLDLASANFGSNDVSVRLGDGSGNFSGSTNIPVGIAPNSVGIGDFNGDGMADFVTSNFGGTAQVSIRLGNGAGDFPVGRTINTGVQSYSFAIGDFNGDSKADLIVTNTNEVNILLWVPETNLTITSFSPPSGPAGTSVTISGTNFNANPASNNVYFGDIKAIPSSGSSTSLTVSVPAGTASVVPIIVQDANTSYQQANSLTSLVSAGPRQFTITHSPVLPVGPSNYNRTNFVAGAFEEPSLGDFNGDGNTDLITTDPVNNNIFISLGNGTGGFNAPSSVAALGAKPFVGPIGDFNSDGRQDFVVANYGGSDVTLYLGVGNGTFYGGVSWATEQGPYQGTATDLNNDGNLDLVIANRDFDPPVGETMSVLLGTGTGVFAPQQVVNIGGNSSPTDIKSGDFNGDGNADVIVTRLYQSGVVVYFGDGTGGFSSSNPISTNNYPDAIKLGDFNNDHDLDFVVQTNYTNELVLYINDGAGNFTPSAIGTIGVGDFTATGAFSRFVVGNFDGDNNMDIAYSDVINHQVGIILGNGDWTFDPPVYKPVPDIARGIVASDFNNDGKADIAVLTATSMVSVLLYTDSFTPSITSFAPSAGPVGTSVTITGTNFDPTASNNIVYFGATRATVSSASATELSVTVPSGATYQPITITINGLTASSNSPFIVTFPGIKTIDAGSFGSKVDFSTDGTSTSVVSGDIDGDGKSDIVTVGNGANSLSVFRNTGNTGQITTSSFDARVDFPVLNNPIAVALADLDGDGKLDVVVANRDSDLISIFRNNSSPGVIDGSTFDTRADLDAGSQPSTLAFADFDGDGKQDILVTEFAGTVAVYRNIASPGSLTSGSFEPRVNFFSGSGPYGVSVGDLDADGKPDFAVTNLLSNTVSVFRNISPYGIINAGSFDTKVDFAVGTNPLNPVIGDLDNDGKPDLAVAISNDGTVSVFKNIGTGSFNAGSFAAKVDLPAGQSPYFVNITDIDGDSKPDLTIGNYADAPVLVLKNATTTGVINSSSFDPAVGFTAGQYPSSVFAGDLNGDNQPDLIVSNSGANSLSILQNRVGLGSPPTVLTSDSLALVAFYNSTNGPSWTNHSNWLTGPVDTWNGIIVNANRVNTITLYNNNLTGTLPPELGDLDALQYLELGLNQIGGSIPVEIGNLTNLVALSFRDNVMTGTLPTVLGNLTGLINLELAYNQFTGDIPVELGNLTNLTTLELLVNQLTGPIPTELGNLTNLTLLNLSGNFLTGGIPASLGNLSNLERLLLFYNPLGGSIPPELGNLTNLQSLQLVQNQLTGEIPPEFASLSNLNDLNLNTNQLTGSIPSFLGSLSLLQTVDLSNNQFTGTLPPELGGLNALSSFTIFNNQLEGEIPAEIGNLPAITTLNLGKNQFYNYVPASFNNLSTLQYLSVEQNQLSGFDPTLTALTNLTQLTTLKLDNNIFADLPNLSALTAITSLTLQNNTLTFEDLEPLAGVTGVQYSPQQNFGSGGTISIVTGNPIFLQQLVGGSANQYQWYKNAGVLSGATANPFTISPASAADGGTYHLEVTSPLVPGLTLISYDLIISVILPGAQTYFTWPVNDGIINDEANYSFGGFWADFDNDGDDDLAISNQSNAPGRGVDLYQNNGGTFTRLASAGMPTEKNPRNIAWADFDNDGDIDFYTGDFGGNPLSDGNAAFYSNNSDGTFTKIPLTQQADGGAWVDYDNDGLVDLFTMKPQQTTLAYKNQGGGSFSLTPGLFTTGSDFVLLFADIDNDHDLDMLQVGKTDASAPTALSEFNSLLRNDGNGVYTYLPTNTINTDNLSDARGGSWADIDNDGDMDFFALNWAAGGAVESAFYLNDGAGNFTKAAASARLGVDVRGRASVFGDIDNDGDVDLVITNRKAGNTGTNLFLNNGSGSFTQVPPATQSFIPLASQGITFAHVSLGDANNDGFLDIFSSTYSVQQSPMVYRSVGNANKWIRFKLQGTPSNRSGVGARIEVIANSKTQIREVTTTSGASGQNSLVQHFGLGPATQVDQVTVYWPSGTVQTLNNVAVNQQLTILEGSFQVPVITSFAPQSGVVGTTVVITGDHFDPVPANNIVYFGATKANVTAATPTQLTVTVPAGATYKPITVEVNGLIGYSATPFVVTFPGGGVIDAKSFSHRINYETGSGGIQAAAIGDMDGDGKSDVVISHNSGIVSVLRNISSTGIIGVGAFAAPVDFGGVGSLYNIALEDLDGDGKLDIVSPYVAGGVISILRNTSTPGSIDGSSFAGAVNITATSGPGSIAIGDIDHDGKPDLATTSSNSNTISILKNVSVTGLFDAGSFSPPVDFATGALPTSIAMGDIDGDGSADLVVTNANSNNVSVFRNTASIGIIDAGSFAPKVDFATGSYPFGVAIGDLDNDGKPDLAITNFGNSVSVLRNSSTAGSINAGSLATRVDFPTGPGPNGVSIDDLNGDGKPEIAVWNNSDLNISIFRNTSATGIIDAGSFAAKADYQTETTPTGLAIGDIDGDGKSDLVVPNVSSSSFSVIRNKIGEPLPPVISSFTPQSGIIGTAVTINGTGFAPAPSGNIVYFGATKAVVTAASITQLTVTVPAGATYEPITVQANGLTGYSSKPFVVTFPGGDFIDNTSFAPLVDFNTGSNPYGIAVGDLDGDGKGDMVVANYSNNTISIYRNTSSAGTITSGSFALKVDLPAGVNPQRVAIGDIDGDGKLDIAVANYGSSSVSVFRNTSSVGVINAGSFASAVDYAAGASPSAIQIGDLDGNGKPELVVSNYLSSTLSIYTNTGSVGQITPASLTRTDVSTGVNPWSVAIGDLDADGWPDLVSADAGSGTLTVLKNNSSFENVSFSVAFSFPAGSLPYGVSIGDLDLDTKPDLVVINQNDNTISVFRNTSTPGVLDGTSFAAKVDFATGLTPFGISIGDIDGNGKPELVVTNEASNTISVFRNVSTAGQITTSSFATKSDFITGSSPFAVAIADLDGDGKSDLAVANGGDATISILRKITEIQLPTITSFSPQSGIVGTPVTVVGTNFSTTPTDNIVYFGATKANVTAATATQLTVTVPVGATYKPITVEVNARIAYSATPFIVTFPGGPVNANSFDAGINFATDLAPKSMATGDLDGDGKTDIAVINNQSVSVFRNTSATGVVTGGSFAPRVDFSTGPGSSPYFVTMEDMDLDGKLDLIVANYGNSYMSMLRNTSTTGIIDINSFDTRVDLPVAAGQYTIAIGDLDHDGKPDLAMTNSGNDAISIFRNTSIPGTLTAATFDPKVNLATGVSPFGLVMTDIDGDGRTDLAVSNQVSTTISIFRNISTPGFLDAGSFASKVDFASGSLPNVIAAGDIDGDGKVDLTVSNLAGDSFSVFRNTSTSGVINSGSLAAKVDFATDGQPYGMAIGDLNGDSRADIMIANQNSNSISLFRNASSAGVINAGSLSRFDYTTELRPVEIAIGDMDGDGKTDFAVVDPTNNLLTVFRNKMGGTASSNDRHVHTTIWYHWNFGNDQRDQLQCNTFF